jgi:hypothetical protein
MTVSCGLISSIFIGQAIVLLITVAVELHCGFNILCVLDTLSPLPLIGRRPHVPHGALVVDFETGMMDNVAGAVFGYMVAMIVAVWALAPPQLVGTTRVGRDRRVHCRARCQPDHRVFPHS